MISALADAGAVLDRARLPRRRRARPPSSCCASCATATGRLLRTYNRGQAQPERLPRGPRVPARGAADALRGDVRPALVRRGARAGRRRSIERFGDAERGGFFSTADDHETLIARRKELEDAPIPAGGSAAAFGLLRLARADRRARATRTRRSADPAAARRSRREHPDAFGHLLQAIDFHLADVREVALVGRRRGPLERVVREAFRPHVVLAGGAGRRRAAAGGPRAGRRPRGGLRLRALRLPRPVTEPDELAALLACSRTSRPPVKSGGPDVQAAHAPRAARGKFFVLIAALLVFVAAGPLVGQVRGRAEERDRRSCPATPSRSRR